MFEPRIAGFVILISCKCSINTAPAWSYLELTPNESLSCKFAITFPLLAPNLALSCTFAIKSCYFRLKADLGASKLYEVQHSSFISLKMVFYPVEIQYSYLF